MKRNLWSNKEFFSLMHPAVRRGSLIAVRKYRTDIDEHLHTAAFEGGLAGLRGNCLPVIFNQFIEKTIRTDIIRKHTQTAKAMRYKGYVQQCMPLGHKAIFFVILKKLQNGTLSVCLEMPYNRE